VSVGGGPKAKPITKSLADAKPLFTGKARVKVVSSMNVFDAALERMRWIFDEFDNKVMVSTSGGKDSTVTLELAAMVARERGVRVKAWWLDQECEFQSTVEYQRYVMYERQDDIEMIWYQIPFLLENSTNHTDPWLKVWDPELSPSEWVREKEPTSVHENPTGQMYWHDLLNAIATHHADRGTATLDGIRGEESPARRLLLTSRPMYKFVTWSNVDCAPGMEADPINHRFRFHPIYDWSYRDIWKAIYDHGWRYNEHYDHLFQRGVPTKNMRVSNFHHESALSSLEWLQEIEPETWERATRRLEGISSYGHIGKDSMPTSLPYMFASWDEYLEYLIDNLVTQPDDRVQFRKLKQRLAIGAFDVEPERRAQIMVGTVIGNDLYGTHIGNFMVSHRAKRKQSALAEQVGARA
jgi:predicted phosphoadenosine phosphosulfate sulfurtransferase